jgi:hypothetical protein
MTPKTPKEAKAQGFKYYKSDRPCKNGVIELRYINGNCMCFQCKFERNVRLFKGKPRTGNYIPRGLKYLGMTANERNRAWKKANKDKVNAINATRRAAKANATPKWFSELDEFVIEEAFSLTIQREKLTGIRWDVDHMIPLRANEACGLHCYQNIQVIPKSMNSAKRNKMIFTEPLEWLNG